MAYKPSSPQQILNHSVYQGLLRRIETNAELLRRVKAGLPEPMARHCQYCLGTEGGGIVIFSDSQAFSAQLRFYAPSILARVNVNMDPPFKQVSVRNLPLAEPVPMVKPMKPVSAAAIKAVKASSTAAPGDELAIALAKLGATMERFAKGKT
ncbi:MAG: DciA family protein [Candidatus Methylumidiphilus sp.]